MAKTKTKLNARIENAAMLEDLRSHLAKSLPGAERGVTTSVVLDVALALMHKLTFDPALRVLDVDKLNQCVERDRGALAALMQGMLRRNGIDVAFAYEPERARFILEVPAGTFETRATREAQAAPATCDPLAAVH